MLLSFMLCLFIYVCLCYLCRTIALAATVICWLYPTLDKIYLILSYLTDINQTRMRRGQNRRASRDATCKPSAWNVSICWFPSELYTATLALRVCFSIRERQHMLAPVQWNTRQFLIYIGMLTGVPLFFSIPSGGGGCLCGMSVPCSNKTLWRCSVISHRGRTGSPIIFNCFNSLGSLVF